MMRDETRMHSEEKPNTTYDSMFFSENISLNTVVFISLEISGNNTEKNRRDEANPMSRLSLGILVGVMAKDASKYRHMPHTTMANKLRMIEVLNAAEIAPFKKPKIIDIKTDSIKIISAHTLGFLMVIVSIDVADKTIKIIADVALFVSINFLSILVIIQGHSSHERYAVLWPKART